MPAVERDLKYLCQKVSTGTRYFSDNKNKKNFIYPKGNSFVIYMLSATKGIVILIDIMSSETQQ